MQHVSTFQKSLKKKYQFLVQLIQIRTSVSEECQADMKGIVKKFNTYRIGVLKTSRGENKATWFRLFALKPNKQGWFYFQGFKNTHLRLSIHTKLRKNKKYNKGFVVLDNNCWNRLSNVINSSNNFKTITIEKFMGDEAYEDFGMMSVKQAKTVGILRIVD